MYSSLNRVGLASAVVILALSNVAGVGGAGAPQSPPTAAPQPQKPAVQTPPVAFTTTVNAVQVDTIVIDKVGRFVSDLRADEFEVLEDGKPQSISGFSLVNLSANRELSPVQAGRPVAVDTQSNDRAFDGRLYLIVLDDLHITALRTNGARSIAKQFIDKNIGPGDLAAVITTSGARSAVQGFTSNKAALLQVVQRCVGRKVISPGLAGLSMDGTPEAANPEAAKPERIFNARSSLETLTRMAAYAGTVRNRRKALVLIGEGIDYQFGSQDDESRELRDQYRSFVGAANRANLIVYAFDPRVFSQGGDDFVDIASTPPGDMEAGQEKVKTHALQDTMRASQDNLRALSIETGGFAVVGSQSFLPAFDRVRVENSNYYMLGYTPTNQAQDGKFREIEVRVKRPGLVVQARKGYTALTSSRAVSVLGLDVKSGTSAVLREALVSALPVTGFTMRAAAIPYQGTPAKASVLVLVQASGRELLFASSGDKMMDSVELAVVAVDPNGKTLGGERVMVDMPLSARMQKFVTQSGVLFQVRLDVPPGTCQLRIAGRDMGSGTVGSLLYDLDVPDFFATPLSMSGVALTGEEAGLVPSPKPDPIIEKLLPGTPVTQRVFSATDTVTALVEVYDNQRGGPTHTVYIATSVATEDGKVLFREEASRPSADLKGGRGAFGHTVKIPLRDLGSGSFILKIEARSSLGTTTVVSRETPFRVR